MDWAYKTLPYVEKDTLNYVESNSRAERPLDPNMGSRIEIAPGVFAYGVNDMKKSFKDPMLVTKWDQGSPYNMFCPNNSFAGCVAIAIAQIAAYHNKPASLGGFYLSWPDLTKYPSIEELSPTYQTSLAQFIRNVGSCVNMQYGIDIWGSSSATLADALSGYSQLGFETDEPQSFTFENVRESLENDRPVNIFGYDSSNGGHSWDTDGYRSFVITSRYYREDNDSYCFTTKSVYNYIHMNFGWGGNSDAFYLCNHLDFNYPKFNEQIYIVTNIH